MYSGLLYCGYYIRTRPERKVCQNLARSVLKLGKKLLVCIKY